MNFIVGWRWFMKSCRDWSWLVVPRKMRKMLSMNLFQKRIAQIKTSRMVSLWRLMEKLAYGGAALIPMAVPTSWRKCLSMNESSLFLRMVSSNIPIVCRLEHLRAGCQHVISCTAIQVLCPLNVICWCKVM